MSTGITFDANDLQTANIITSQINHSSIPAKDAKLFALANANKSVIQSIYYPSKSITVSGKLIADSVSAMDTLEDTFKNYFRGKNKNLDIDHGGSTRRYIATVNGLSIDRPGGLQWADFTLEFICAQPFGVETSATTITDTLNHTAASLTVAPTIGGTAPEQSPIITITVDAVTGTGDYILVSNDNNGQSILVSGQSLIAGDVLVIDCYERTVTLNGDQIDYVGVFIELEPGSQSISYSDGFTTRTVDINIVYYKRYL